MNYLYALVAAAGLVLGAPAIASADVTCGGGCVVDTDGTQGDITEGQPGWFGTGSFGPLNGTHAVLDDTGSQDQPHFDNDRGTYPLDDDSTADVLENEDISGS